MVPEWKRRRRRIAKWRRVVEETLVPGASAAGVGRAHDVKANQVSQGRRLCQRGLLSRKVHRPAGFAGDISDRAWREAMVGARSTPVPVIPPKAPGGMQIGLAKGREPVEGSADAALLRVVMGAFARVIAPPAHTRI